jgi:hypothetical protein
MKEIARNPVTREALKKDDLLLILGKNDNYERAGTVDSIDKHGTVWINYGGYVTVLYGADQIRVPPEEEREAIALRLKEQNDRMRELLQEFTGPIADEMVKLNKNEIPWKKFLNLFK